MFLRIRGGNVGKSWQGRETGLREHKNMPLKKEAIPRIPAATPVEAVIAASGGARGWTWALLAGVVPLGVAGLMPQLPDFHFWSVSPFKYVLPWGGALFLLLGLLAAVAVAGAGKRIAWLAEMPATLERLFFSDARRWWYVLATAAALTGLVCGCPIYDVVGDNVANLKWVVSPLAQGEARAIPNTYVFHLLLQPWLGNYDQLVGAWRWLSRLATFPYVLCGYLVCRRLPQGRLHAFALLLVSGSALFNYFGHVDYYSLQTIYFLLALLGLQLVLEGRWPVWALAPIWLAGSVGYLPIGLTLLFPCVYVAMLRLCRHWPPSWTKVAAVGIAVAAVACMPLVTKSDQSVPLFGTHDAIFSVNRAAVFFNHLVYSVPLLVTLVWVSLPWVWRLLADSWKQPFAHPWAMICFLMPWPGLFINAVSNYYYGWFDLDNMGIYLTLPLLFFFSASLSAPVAPEGNSSGRQQAWNILFASVVLLSAMYSALQIRFFQRPECLKAFADYVDRYTGLKGSFSHSGNRTPVLLALGEYQFAGEWLRRSDTAKFPISLLNWQDVLVDCDRKQRAGGFDMRAFDVFRDNPWFWLVQLQPAFYFQNTNPAWLRQREAIYQMLAGRLNQFPPAARATYYAFRYMDRRLLSAVSAEDVETGLAGALADYFAGAAPQGTGAIQEKQVALKQEPNRPMMILDVTGRQAGADATGQPFHYQFYYYFSGANHVTATNMLTRTSRAARATE